MIFYPNKYEFRDGYDTIMGQEIYWWICPICGFKNKVLRNMIGRPRKCFYQDKHIVY